MKRCFAIVLMALLMSGCAVYQASSRKGPSVADSKINQIEKGKTTKSDIYEALGFPDSIQVTDSLEVWTYHHVKWQGQSIKPTNGTTSDTLLIYFHDDTVERYQYANVASEHN